MILFVILMACTAALAEHLSGKPYDLNNTPNLFKEFVRKYNKAYSPDEYLKRQEIFHENLKEINEHNSKESSAEFGITHFADLTAEEREQYFGFKPLDESFYEKAVHLDIPDEQLKDLPDTFDWRDHNAVTRVKNQLDGQSVCGSAWIFSAIGSIEGQYAIKYNQSIEFSEQQALDCVDPYDQVSNCHGGWPHEVMLYNMDGVVSEKDYNYTGKPSVCFDDVLKVAAKVDSVTYYKPTEESLMKLLFEKGPLSVALQGTDLIWYSKGIINPEFQCHGAVNHAALLVGYGEGPARYWILKNSWGENWGENGYFRMDRGLDACLMGTSYTAVCTVA